MSFVRTNPVYEILPTQICDCWVNTELICRIISAKNFLDGLCIRSKMNRLPFTFSTIQLSSVKCTDSIEYELIAWTTIFFIMNAATLSHFSSKIIKVSESSSRNLNDLRRNSLRMHFSLSNRSNMWVRCVVYPINILHSNSTGCLSSPSNSWYLGVLLNND